MSRFFLLGLVVFLSIGFTQNIVAQQNDWWEDLGEQPPVLLRNQQVNIETHQSYYIKVDLSALQRLSQITSKEDQFDLELPNPKGKKWTFSLELYEMMETGLQTKYATIRTYRGFAKDQPNYKIHLTLTNKVWFASVSNGVESWFIDPFTRPYDEVYQVYYKEDCAEDRLVSCGVIRSASDEAVELRAENEKIEGELRTFRLAVSASFDYTNFHGGTKEGAMVAIVNTINRVNLVYERDMAVRMILVANNDSLIVTDPDSELFTAESLEGIENQEFIDQIIGTENYDIGHVFDLGAGGYADLGGVCDEDFKARGYTALSRPQGDAFDIDFVAHEIGHQFGANHTFNGLAGSCGAQRTLNTSFEPGAGTTIMSYAGICSLDNITPNSSDYFHGGSIVEMNRFLTLGRGRRCVEKIALQNQAPQIILEEDLHFIPSLTPFELSAQVTDLENDQLTYNWEQVDAGTGASLGTYGDNDGPLFRSFPAVSTPDRVFPNMEDLLLNNFPNTELLPNASRELNFQLTVRDNHPQGGGVTWDRVKYFVDGEAGPFRMENLGPLVAGANTVFRWDVANTNVAPINLDSVDLYLSTDGGQNFDQYLGRHSNDGFTVAFIPERINSNTVRFKLKAVDNIFFDISDLNSVIRLPENEENFIRLIGAAEELSFCALDSIRIPFYYNFFSQSDSIQIGINATINGFSGAIDPIENNRFDLVLMGGNQLATAIYPIDLVINLGEEATDTLSFNVDLLGANLNLATIPNLPANNAGAISIFPNFNWQGNALADVYQVEISLDPLFEEVLRVSPLLEGLDWVVSTGLEPETSYFWRVTAINERCGQRTTGPVQQFTTETVACRTYTATDLPIAFNAFPFIQSSIEVEEDAVLVDVNVLNITGAYDRSGGIDFRLRSPQGPVLTVLDRQNNCSQGDRFNFSLDDDRGQSFIPCPNNQGVTLNPANALQAFNGQNAKGRWTLSIFDDNGNGELESWSLELCFGASAIVNTSEASLELVSALEVFPNPIKDEVQFNSQGEVIQDIYLLNTTGQIVRAFLNLDTQNKSITVSNLVPGVYLYQVIFKNGSRQTGKLVK